jgi:hypothetical protein
MRRFARKRNHAPGVVQSPQTAQSCILSADSPALPVTSVNRRWCDESASEYHGSEQPPHRSRAGESPAQEKRYENPATSYLVLVNCALLILPLAQPHPVVAEAVPVLRGRAFEVVDGRGRVRASITVLAADPAEKMTGGPLDIRRPCYSGSWASCIRSPSIFTS